ncbi:DnaB family ATPase, partial [Pseudomonas aeruginosa]
SEVYFAREVSGKSMTETSTKITNEVDGVITIHVAKTSMKNYFTCSIGKQRGEGCSPEKRFFIYDLDPVLGLVHD